MTDESSDHLTTAGTRDTLRAALLRNDPALKTLAVRATTPKIAAFTQQAELAAKVTSMFAGVNKAADESLEPLRKSLAVNRIAMAGILASQRAADIDPVRIPLPSNAQAERDLESIDLLRETLEQQKLMVQVLQGLHDQQVATEKAARERDAAQTRVARRDLRVNVATLLITVLSLMIAVLIAT